MEIRKGKNKLKELEITDKSNITQKNSQIKLMILFSMNYHEQVI